MIQIEVPHETTITVIGDIHEHDEQFYNLLDIVKPSKQNILVSVGDIYGKGFGLEAANKITRTFKDLVEKKSGYVVQGNHEYKRIKGSQILNEELTWFSKQPFSLCFKFSSGTRLVVIHGGVKPNHKWEDLNSSSDVLFIRTLDENGDYIPLKWIEQNGKKIRVPKKNGRNWHEVYDGRFGYIASGHSAQTDGVPKFFSYSCNLDTAVYETGILTAQRFNESGRMELTQVKGKSKNGIR